MHCVPSTFLSTLSTFLQPFLSPCFPLKLTLFIFQIPCYNLEHIKSWREGVTMANFTLSGNGLLSSTSIPNVFIDKYMIAANGEFVKIYLYLIRCMEQNKSDCSLLELADVFNHTEKDVLRAIAYWEKLHLLHVEYNAQQEVSGISLDLPDDGRASCATAQPLPPESYGPEPEDSLPKDEDVQEILYITEQYLGRTLNPTDVRTILYWHDGLGFSTDLIVYLMETCISNGHTSLRYMEKIALSWADDGISTVEEARREHSVNRREAYAVMNAFGISGRNLIDSEMQMIQKWTGSYAFSMDLIKDACRRAIQATGKASFAYADTILTNWHKNDVHTLKDIVKLDAARQKKPKADAKSSKAAQQTASGTRFNNFPQRTYNYDQLEKQLLNTTH